MNEHASAILSGLPRAKSPYVFPGRYDDKPRAHITHLLKQVREKAVVPETFLFEFIHPFADGNGRMGRLWQTLILSKWRPVLAYMPVETLVRNRQEEYYASLAQADMQGEATKFIEFMLQALHDTLAGVQTDQAGVHINDQVKRLEEESVCHVQRLSGVHMNLEPLLSRCEPG